MALALFLVRDTNTPQKNTREHHHYYQLLVKKIFTYDSICWRCVDPETTYLFMGQHSWFNYIYGVDKLIYYKS